MTFESEYLLKCKDIIEFEEQSYIIIELCDGSLY